MSEKKISYINRNFEDYQSAFKEYTAKFYPDIATDLNDASVGSWLIDLLAAGCDNLSQAIDKAYNETNLDSAQQASSVYALARSNGLKVPGPKPSMAEAEFKIIVPVNDEYIANPQTTKPSPDFTYAPVLRQGSQVSNGSQIFEVMSDIDFSEVANADNVANQKITPAYDNNGDVKWYEVTKTDVIMAGRSKVYTQVLTSADITPFMEVIIPDKDVMCVDSIVFKVGTNFSCSPSVSEFMMNREYKDKGTEDGAETYRFFEVNSLVDHYRWGDDTQIKDVVISTNTNGKITYSSDVPQSVIYGYEYGDDDTPLSTAKVTKGKWIPVTQKFITEFTDSGYLKVIFGSGTIVGTTADYSNATDYSQYQISKMVQNDFLGRLPQAGWTMFIRYRVGGGADSNVAAGTITNFVTKDTYYKTAINTTTEAKAAAAVNKSMTVTNTTPSISGRNMPSVAEIKAMIKYNNGAQQRCVTVKDYESRVQQMPVKYGCPFRVKALEENNKIVLYIIGVDGDGKLSTEIPETLMTNMLNYLSMYRSVNDYVEVKSGRIINLGFDVDVFIDRNYNTAGVVNEVINTIENYMDINNFDLGDDVYVSDIEKEIMKIDGVISIIDLRVINKHNTSEGYSASIVSQPTKNTTNDPNCSGESTKYDYNEGESEIDLEASDYVLKTDVGEMFEIKKPEEGDIRVRVRTK